MAIDANSAPTPALADAFVLTVTPAETMVVGTLATGGVREHRPAAGGEFAGRGIAGNILSGGETLLRRPDGVAVLEANYLIAAEEGEIIRLVGTGYATGDGSFVGTRMTIMFEVDEQGRHAALSTRAYVGERSSGSDALRIAEVL
jgi:hypothetical protein